MIRYYVESHHRITAEDFFDGCEGPQIDEFMNSSIVEATDPIDAITAFTKDLLSRKLRRDKLMSTSSSYCYSFLENENHDEPDVGEIMDWKEGKLSMYNNFIVFKVFELKEINYVTE